MAKAPAARGFTLAEKRALTFERVSLYMVFLVALIAAALSFIALRAVGADAGLGSASFLLPIAIDGFGIACSVGIVRSVASGEGLRDRASEWVGLFVSLGLSVLGNVHHALKVGAVDLPDYVKIAYSGAIPVIVAYGIHVYGRAMAKGISAHVLASDPEQLTFGLAHLGDDRAHQPRATRPAPRAQQQTATRATSAQPGAQSSAQPARTTPAQATPTPAPAARAPKGDDAREVLFEEYRRRLNEGDRMEGGEIAERLGIHPGNARTLRKKWDARLEELAVAEPQRDPIMEQVGAGAGVESKGSAAVA